MLGFALVVLAGLNKLFVPMVIFAGAALTRAVFGLIGSASNPAAQAYVADRSQRSERTGALATLASAFGLGTILGPAVAPLFILPGVGLAGPMFAFAILAFVMTAVVQVGLPNDAQDTRKAAAKALASPADPSPWQTLQGFRLNAAPHYAVKLICGSETRLVEIDPALPCPAKAWPYGDDLVVFEAGQAHTFRAPAPDALSGQASGDGILLAPMPGKIVACPVKPGDTVLKGDPIITLEAMKMEHVLTAPFDGVVERVNASLGDQVVEGLVLARLTASADRQIEDKP